MIQAVTRFVLVVAGLLGGYVVTKVVDWQTSLGLEPAYVIFLFVILGASMGFVMGGIVGRELSALWQRTEKWLSDLSGVDLTLGTVGMIVGLLVAFLASQPLRLLEPAPLAIGLSVFTFVMAVYIGINAAMTRRREFALMFPGFASAESTFGQTRIVALDTSGVIDGRFVELRRLGYFPGQLRVPRFVLSELHTLADSADDTKRSRGRRGIDLLATLPEDQAVMLLDVDYPELPGVDEKLMRLAADSDAIILTVDFNLTKVARVRGIEVLNLNEAAGALRPSFLPGDTFRLNIARSGKEADQGVGYLEDGTMVVVSDGRDLVGSDAEVEVTSVLQTSAGRMIFARPDGSTKDENDSVGSKFAGVAK